MIRILGVFFMVCFISVSVFASTITTFLEVVLQKDGELIDGITDVTVELKSPQGVVKWTENHSTQFFKGRASFELGSKTPFETIWFYDQGVQFVLKVDGESILLPIQSIPFSIFSHAADIVNAIHMEGVFHTNLHAERIGINIDHVTPSVRLEVGGALRVGDNDSIDELGAIRWRNNRLEGRHNEAWKMLDVGPADGFESKWSYNNVEQTPAFYVLNTLVNIKTNTSQGMLTVGGSMYVDESVTVDGVVDVDGRLNLLDYYGVTDNSDIIARSVTINASNYISLTNGLKVSGRLIGKGHGVSNIGAVNLMNNAIQNNEIADLAITSLQLAPQSVDAHAIDNAVINRNHLISNFELTNPYFKSRIISNNEIKVESLSTANLAAGFEFNINLFKNGAIVSRNIGAQNLDQDKILDRTLSTNDYASPLITIFDMVENNTIVSADILDQSILANDFEPQALLFDHLDSIMPIDKGGTNQSSYLTDGLIVVSSNQFVSTDQFKITDAGFGVYTQSPEKNLDIVNQSGRNAVSVISSGAYSAGYGVGNDVGKWFIETSENGNLNFIDGLQSDVLLSFNTEGHMGIKSDPDFEKLVINGGLLVGDTDLLNPKPGTLFFSEATNTFKLVLQSGVTSLESQPPTERNKSYLYATNINDQSKKSRVILGTKTDLFGTNHMIMGSTDSFVSGDSHQLGFLTNAMVFGESQHAFMVNDTTLDCDNGVISYASFTNISGKACQFSHVENSRLSGNYLMLDYVKNSLIYGDHTVAKNVYDSEVSGENNYLTYTNQSLIQGNGHILKWTDTSVVLGEFNQFDHMTNMTINGNGNSGMNLSQSIINGDKNHVELADGAVVIGDHQLILNGDGVYKGQSNVHIGSGSPSVNGDSNYIVGHNSGDIAVDHSISIGTNKHHSLSTDESIVIYAPGGIDIVNGDYIVAHLPTGAGSWAVSSDQAIKMNVTGLDPTTILEKVLDLPIFEWNYKGQHYIQHIGPMAQDFYQSFGFGRSNKYIQSVDMDGVIFSSIKGLGKVYNAIETQQERLVKDQGSLDEESVQLYSQLKDVQHAFDDVLKKDDHLIKQFEHLHKSESDQLKRIEALNKKITRFKLSKRNAQ